MSKCFERILPRGTERRKWVWVRWVRSGGFATRAMLGARGRNWRCAEREVGRGARNFKTRETKELGTSSVAHRRPPKT